MNSVIEPQLPAGFELQTGTGKVTILSAHKDFWRLSHYVLHKKKEATQLQEAELTARSINRLKMTKECKYKITELFDTSSQCYITKKIYLNHNLYHLAHFNIT